MFMRGLIEASGMSCIPISKFTDQIREFDRQCEALLQLIPRVFYSYQWTTERDCEEKVCTLQCLGFRLFRLLDEIRMLMQYRGEMLCNEHCDAFSRMVSVVDEYVRHIKHFIQDADQLINEAEKDAPQRVEQYLLPIMQRMDGLKEWIAMQQLDDDLLGRASAKCDELNLHFDMNLTLDNVDELRYWTRMALNGITLLAVPSLSVDCEDDEMCSLYDRSMDAFCADSYWMGCRMDYAQKIDRILERECKNQKEKRQRLLLLKEQHLNCVKEILAGHGIAYKGVEEREAKAALCRGLYRSLNISDVRMSNDELCRYFYEEAHIRYLQERLDGLCPKRGRQMGKCLAVHGAELFHAKVDMKRMAVDLHKVFNHFFGKERQGRLRGVYNEEIDLAAILFILVTECRLGGPVFESKGCLPFYNFLKENVWEIKKGYKTLSNRIKKKDGPYGHIFEKVADGKLSSADFRQEDGCWKNYQAVREVFLPMVG